MKAAVALLEASGEGEVRTGRALLLRCRRRGLRRRRRLGGSANEACGGGEHTAAHGAGDWVTRGGSQGEHERRLVMGMP